MPEGERSPKDIELQSSLGDHSQTFAAQGPHKKTSMKTITPTYARYRLLATSWRAYALALVRLKAAPPTPPRLTPNSQSPRWQINWGLLFCLICFCPIGYLFFHRPDPDPLTPEISTTPIEVPAPHHFDMRYFNPTLGSVHQLVVPGVGWMLTAYKGTVADLAKLPATPAPGDMYYCPKANGSYWVWAVLRGQRSRPGWILKFMSNGFHFHLPDWAPKRLVQAYEIF
jgi:hypothetical protein